MYALDWLGPVELRRAGTPVPLPIRKTLALLVLLAGSGAMRRERIVAVLWPALDESAARRNLRRELARLREIGAEGLVLAEGDVLRLAPGTDIATTAFDDALQAGQPDAALALWRGPPADGLHLDDAEPWNTWMGEERRRLEALRAQALAFSAQQHEEAGAYDTALQRVQTLLADDPLQERHHVQAMRLLERLGRREAALAQFDTCTRLLRDELGLEPMAPTRALAAELRGSPEPRTAPQPAPAGPAAASASALVPEQLPFVGREADVAWLERAWRSGRPILIEGEGGIGKTRLATDFASAHGPYASVSCRPGDAELPLATYTRALRALAGPDPDASALAPWVRDELARLMPELGAAPPPLRSEEERARFAQACTLAWQQWAAEDFDAVVVDDWHLADATSQALLLQAAGGGTGARLILVYRPELTPAAQALVQREQQGGAMHRRLEPLPPEALLSLLQRLSGRPDPRRFAAMLASATEGNPFYVAETLRHLVEQGLLSAAPDGRWRTPYDEQEDAYRALPLPESVGQAVLARVERLSAQAQRVLEAASLAEEPLAAAMLAPACAISEVETTLALEDALQVRLLRDDDARGLVFAHDLVRQALEAALSPARRRSVHRRLALGAEAAGMAPARIAAHHEAGGEAARAVRWRTRAGDEAFRLHALDDAVAQWQAALADGAVADDALRLGRLVVRALELRDALDAARARADELLQAAQSPACSAEARLEAVIFVAGLHARRGQPARALQLLDALPALPTRRLQALALQARSDAVREASGRVDDATQLARQALALDSLYAEERALLLDSLILAEGFSGRLRQALELVDQSLALSRASGNRYAVVREMSRRGAMLMQLGDPSAEAVLREAADLAGRTGIIGTQRNVLFNLCVLYSAQSRPDAVLAAARECWDIQPPMASEPLRTMVQLAFVEAHVALGRLGDAHDWALRAINDATAIGKILVAASVVLTTAELLAVLGAGERLQPLMTMLEQPLADQWVSFTSEAWLVLTECALLLGQTAQARRHGERAAAGVHTENERVSTRAAIVEAALLHAGGDPRAALQRLPTDDAPGLNDELRWRALAVRLRAQAASGGCTPQALADADAALARDGVHALAALLLHQALVQVAPTAARRKAWRERVQGLAHTLDALPAERQAFLQRFPPGG